MPELTPDESRDYELMKAAAKAALLEFFEASTVAEGIAIREAVKSLVKHRQESAERRADLPMELMKAGLAMFAGGLLAWVTSYMHWGAK